VGIGIAFGSQQHLDVPLTSIAALVAAATAFAAGTLVARRIPRMDPFLSNAIATGVGSAVLLPLSMITGERWTLPIDLATWVGFGYLVLPGTIGVFGLFLYLLRRLPASIVSYQFVLAPIVSITLGVVLLGESVGVGAVVGAGLVLAGVYIGALRAPADEAAGSARAR
jgi:drug/metabolite transporter (DMT)-like permease